MVCAVRLVRTRGEKLRTSETKTSFSEVGELAVKAMRAVMTHNLGWFNHYLWNDPFPDFASPAVLKKESKDPDKKTTDN